MSWLLLLQYPGTDRGNGWPEADYLEGNLFGYRLVDRNIQLLVGVQLDVQYCFLYKACLFALLRLCAAALPHRALHTHRLSAASPSTPSHHHQSYVYTCPYSFANVLLSLCVLLMRRYYDSQGLSPLWPFGHGLSYTTFGYSGLTVGTRPA